MARPFKCKQIHHSPDVTYFKPSGIQKKELFEVLLTFEELESLRLCDDEEMNQIEAAQKMNVHQSTLQRTLARARRKVAKALVHGHALRIQGGVYTMPNRDGTGPRGEGPRTGRRMGNCSPNTSEKPLGQGQGNGFGRRFGGHHGRQNMQRGQ